MEAHVALHVTVVDPLDDFLQVLLTDRGAGHVIGTKLICRAAGLAEVTFGIGDPWPRVDRVEQLLVGELLPRSIDDPEPVKLLAWGAFAQVHGDLVVAETIFLVGLKIVKVSLFRFTEQRQSEFAVHVLAKRDGALLPIDYLEVIFAVDSPIHHVQREVLRGRLDHRLTLFARVDELPLVWGPDVELTSVGSRT